jgi:hypothetical protein
MEALYNLVNNVTWVAGAGVASDTYEIPAGKTLTIVGDVSLGAGNTVNIEINAYKGTLDLSKGKLIDGGAGDLILLSNTNRTAVGLGGASPKITGVAVIPTPVESITAAIPGTIVGPVMVQSLSLKGTGGTSLSDIAGYITGHDLYVMENLVMEDDDIDLASGGDTIFVYGDIQAKHELTVTDVDGLTLKGSIVAISDLEVDGLTALTLPLDTGSCTVTPKVGTASIGITTLNSSNANGKLALTAADTNINIAGGNGNVVYTGNAVLATNATFDNTGTTTFSGTVSSTPALSFGGPAVFGDTLGIPTAGATFNGTADFAKAVTVTSAGPIVFNGKATFADPAVLTTGTGAITIGATGSLAAAGSSNNIITASGGDVILTPSAATTLTFSAADKKITQGGGTTITIGGTGAAVLATGATYAVPASQILTVGNGKTLQVNANAEVSVLGSFVLSSDGSGEDAILTGAGGVVAGNTTISGGTNGWTGASSSGAGTVTITPNTILTNASTTTLTGVAGDTAPSITVGTTGGKLTVTGGIDLITGAGAVILTGHATTPSLRGALLLKADASNPGTLTTGADVSQSVTRAGDDGSNFFLINASTNTGLVTGPAGSGNAAASIVVKAGGTDAETTPIDLGSIGGGGTPNTHDALITAAGAQNLTIEAGVKITVPQS